MAKLVRDKIDVLFRGRKLIATFEERGPKLADATRTELVSKLLEEVAEVLLATDANNLRQELGDCQSLLWAIGKEYEIDPMEIVVEAKAKDDGRGGFDRLLYMELEDVVEEKEPVVPARGYNTWNSGGYSG